MSSGKFESSDCLRETCLSSVFFVHIFVGKHKTSELQIVLINFTTKQAILHLPVGIIITSSSDKGMNTLKTHSLAFFFLVFLASKCRLYSHFMSKCLGLTPFAKIETLTKIRNIYFFKSQFYCQNLGFSYLFSY